MWYVSWLASAGINSKKPVPVPPQHAYDTAMCRARVKEDFLRSVLTTRFDYCKQNRTENVHTGPGLEARVASEKACSFPCFHIRSTKKKNKRNADIVRGEQHGRLQLTLGPSPLVAALHAPIRCFRNSGSALRGRGSFAIHGHSDILVV